MPPCDIIDMIIVYQVMEFPAIKNWRKAGRYLFVSGLGAIMEKKAFMPILEVSDRYEETL